MGDLKSGLEGAGYRGRPAEVKCQECGKPFQPRDPKHRRCPECAGKRPAHSAGGSARASFEQGYPDYFDADGLLKPEFVTTKAEEIAANLGNERPTRMTMHQLRAFYGHVKLQQGALERGRPFKEVLLEINKLKAFASERASKDKVPRYFEDFIVRNVDKVKDEKSFLKGFVEHFQAVVAYCAGTIRR
jgi:CRISPR/Cas system CSM-associated protein Csm2 small subunit